MKPLSQTPLSILDLAKYSEGQSVADAFRKSKELAQAAEKWGFKRFWLAEHHNIEGVASAATSILISYIADHTKTIRVGSGGIMLPNHPPLVIAEQFGTLATLYPGRIDLGLGRAPGTDQGTAKALRRDPMAGMDFGPMVEELLYFLGEPKPGQKLRAIPGAGADIPIWILGSSTYSARLAAQMGRPYAFAGHFAPAAMLEAFEIYRRYFEPSEALDKPWTMAGVPVLAADTDEEAEFLATSVKQIFLSLVRGQPRATLPPVHTMSWSPAEEAAVHSMTKMLIVGSPLKVRLGLQKFIADTGADELIITSEPYDAEKRLRSFELIAQIARD